MTKQLGNNPEELHGTVVAKKESGGAEEAKEVAVAEAGDRGEEWGHNWRRTAAAPSLFLFFFSGRRGEGARGGGG